MDKFYKTEERFKILEFSDYMIIKPNNKKKYEYCMFFFAGFNENAAKYSYLFKIFLENLNFDIPLKIVIPFLPIYKPDEYPRAWMSNPDKFSQLNAWYSYEITEDDDKTYKFTILPNREKDQKVIKMILKEIDKLGNSEKIILGGFSMGGRYLLEILTKMNINTKFNFVFKSSFIFYNNPKKDEKDSPLNKNKFYCYFSANDKIAIYPRSISSVNILKTEFGNVTVKFDNGLTTHTVDYKCLAYLENILRKEILKGVANF